MDPFECLFQDDIEAFISYLEVGNVNVVDDKGISLLCYAIKLRRNEFFKLLLKSYIQINLADHEGNTAFHYAVQYNRLGYLKMLLKREGEPLVKNNKGRTPFYLACLLGRADMISLYLEQFPFPFDQKDEDGETIFMALVRSKNLSLLKQYGRIDYLETENYLGDTALGIAAKVDSVDITSYLLASGAFINHKNHIGETPLFYAVRNQSVELVGLLLQHGATLVCKNCFQESVLDLKLNHSLREFIEEKMALEPLRSYAKKYPLQHAIYQGDVQAIEKHLKLRYAWIADCYDYTPYDLASLYHLEDLMTKLNQLKKEAKLWRLRQGK